MVEENKQRQIRLTERDERILREHVACFGLTTLEALRRVYWPEYTLDAAKSWVRRMTEASFLAKAPLDHAIDYWHATPQAANAIGLPTASATFRKATQLATSYGTLAFCCLGQRVRRKLTADEFRQQFPELVIGQQIPSEYYLDDERRQLGYILVDAGRASRKVAERLRELISQRVQSETWKHEMLRTRRFLIAVVTSRAEKVRRVQEKLSGLHPEVDLRWEVIPELVQFVPERHRHAPHV